MNVSEIRFFRKMLRRFERLLSDQVKESGGCIGVTLAQCHAILEIEEHGETTIGELSGSLGLDKSTLSRTIDGLVKRGLVERIPHPMDRRVALLHLTEQGAATCKDINRDNDAYFGRILQLIPVEKKTGVVESFGLLVQAMVEGENERRGHGAGCLNRDS